MAASVHRSFAEWVPGFSVVGEATTGADALALMERLRPDLVLLDIYLPRSRFATFRERLETYAALKARLERIHDADQREIDRLYALLRVGGEESLPKGISAPTLALVVDVVRQSDGEVSAAEVARRSGISRGTARRYLEFLSDSGTIELTLRYGAAGRPEHLYSWSGVRT